MKSLSPTLIKTLWRTSLICFVIVVFLLGDALFSIPEWNRGFFYLFEGQVRVLLPFATVFLLLFILLLCCDLHHHS